MKSVEWKTYRTRFLVKAKQLASNLSFTDHLGRQHCGRKGDYLVESSDGVLSIAPRQIFEDIYVPMLTANLSDALPDQNAATSSPKTNSSRLDHFCVEPLRVEKVTTRFHHTEFQRSLNPEKTSRAQRKSPQPVQVPASRLGFM